MLWMLRFCRAIKPRSVWHVDAVRSSRGSKARRPAKTRPLFCGWKARLANQRRGERGRLTPRRSNKNGGLFDSNVFFVCLPVLRKLPTKCDDSEEKQVILAVGDRVRHHIECHFFLSGRSKIEASAFE